MDTKQKHIIHCKVYGLFQSVKFQSSKKILDKLKQDFEGKYEKEYQFKIEFFEYQNLEILKKLFQDL